MTLTTGITVKINSDCYQKIMHWVNMSNFEVSGFGKVESIDGELVVTSVVLLKQENTSGSTDIKGEHIAKAMYELRDEPGSMNFWWHSHVDMSVFWSGTDDKAIESIGKNGWVLASVFNKRSEIRTIYYQVGNEFIPSITVDDIPTTIGYSLSKEQEEVLTKEYNDKVTNKKVFSTTTLPSWLYNPKDWSKDDKDTEKKDGDTEPSLEEYVAGYEFLGYENTDIPEYKAYSKSVSQHSRLAREFAEKQNNKRKKRSRK